MVDLESVGWIQLLLYGVFDYQKTVSFSILVPVITSPESREYPLTVHVNDDFHKTNNTPVLPKEQKGRLI